MTKRELEEVITEYGKDVFHFCCFLTGNQMLAEDLYQDTFLKAVQVCKKLKRSDDIKNYFLGIAVNLWKNKVRVEKRRKEITPIVSVEHEYEQIKDVKHDVLNSIIQTEMEDTVMRVVAMLPFKLKCVVLLYYCEDLDAKEIAGILHIPYGTVLSRLSNARKMIKKEMEVYGYEQGSI